MPNSEEPRTQREFGKESRLICALSKITFNCTVERYRFLRRSEQSAYSPESSVQFKGGYLRVSKVTGARLYSTQLLKAGRHLDIRALLRLPLLPPLAISALVAHSLTGDDKGIW